MLENISKYKIILASQSPRRKELLDGLDLTFEVKTLPGADEGYPDTLQKEEIPLYLSKKKAAHNRPLIQGNTLLITADTIVWIGGKTFGKPRNQEEAKYMLAILSGKTHEVITGVSLTTQEKQKSFHSTSKVEFAKLEEEEIDFYVKKYKPFDKAGAYGIQEWIGYAGVRNMEGSFYNIMGLPLSLLYSYLKNWDKED